MRPIQEPDVVDRSAIVAAAGLLIAATAAGAFVAAELQGCTHDARGGRPFSGSAELDPPREVNGIEMTLFDPRAPGTARPSPASPDLDRYGWVDRESEVVHIPIERAMDVYIDRANTAPAEQKR